MTAPSTPPPPYSPTPIILSSKSTSLNPPQISSSPPPPHPHPPPLPPRRTLLLVYIHGFYGNDQSFRSFPSHIHQHLASSPLSRSHLIRSKVYPRYKTYKAVDLARDNFSAWLEPHEGPATDVVLVGHSMGGLLAAEIVLKPSHDHLRFKHRILGTIALDAPFLGLHPGIVLSGLSSLFRPESPQPNTTTIPLSTTTGGLTDPNFDPPYFNDAPFRERPFFDRAVNFASKHSSEGLFAALGNHVTDHLEFGGCLADYRGLMARYNRIRALEDEERGRVRFVNYYTRCPGRPKSVKPGKDSTRTDSSQSVSTPSEAEPVEEEEEEGEEEPLQHVDPLPISSSESTTPEQITPTDSSSEQQEQQEQETEEELLRPSTPDLSSLDEPSRKSALKEHAHALKKFDKLLRQRQKRVEKQHRQDQKQANKDLRQHQKQAEREAKELLKQAEREAKQEKKQAKEQQKQAEKKTKMKKFCTTPSKINGVMDPTWIPIFIDNVDEVTAHCGLFVPGAHYDALVADVSERIMTWVRDAEK